MKFFLAFAALCVALVASDPLKVGSFNVQIFGAKKAANQEVMNTLAKIFSRYDVFLIQEIRDTNDDSINALLKAVNAAGKKNYGLILSDRLGRTNSKERYGFFYDKNKLSVTDSFHFDDNKHGDIFEREPFFVRFKALGKQTVTDFFLGGIHTSPSKAVQEICDLTKAYEDATKKFGGLKDGIIMGDYNAGCSYFAKKNWADCSLRTDSRFLWLIGDDADTTVGVSQCPYDRVVVGGSKLQQNALGAKTFYYDQEWGISLDKARLVSDHYPVEFTIA